MKKQLLSIIFILPILLTACGSNISTGSAPLAIQETSAAAKPIVESIDTTSEETHSPMEDVPEPAVIRYDGFTLTEIRITEEYPENTFPAVWAAYLVPDCEHIITMHNAVYPNSIGITEMYQYGIADRSGQTLIPCIYDMILCTDKGEYILIGGPEDGLYDKDLHLLEAGYYTHGYEVLDGQYFYLYHDWGSETPLCGYLCHYTEPISMKSYRVVLYEDGKFLAYWYDTEKYTPGLDILDMNGTVLSSTEITEDEFRPVNLMAHPYPLEKSVLTEIRADDSPTVSLQDSAGTVYAVLSFPYYDYKISPVTETGEALVFDGEKSWLLTFDHFSATP